MQFLNQLLKLEHIIIVMHYAQPYKNALFQYMPKKSSHARQIQQYKSRKVLVIFNEMQFITNLNSSSWNGLGAMFSHNLSYHEASL